MRRDLTDIDDIVEGVIRCLDEPATPDPAFDALAPGPLIRQMEPIQPCDVEAKDADTSALEWVCGSFHTSGRLLGAKLQSV